MNFTKALVASALMAGTLATSACSGDQSAKTDDAAQATAETAAAPKTIVETAIATEGFSTLVAAVQAADLVETLSGEGPFTVFAPTDEAFAALPEGTLEAVLADKALLTAILTYHVVPGKVMAADVVTLTEAETVQGQKVAIKVEDGTVMIDNATVSVTDIECSNGVIHVIDAVILPETESNS